MSRPTQSDIASQLLNTVERFFPEEYARNFSVEERRKLAKEGKAMSDLSFPIVNTDDLDSAIKLARSPAQRAFVKKRAKELNATSAIPETWAYVKGLLTAEQAEIIAKPRGPLTATDIATLKKL